MAMTGLVATALTASALTFTTSAPPPTSNAQDCQWRLSAVRLYQEVRTADDDDAQARRVRDVLAQAGVGRSDFLPTRCREVVGNATDRINTDRDRADDDGDGDGDDQDRDDQSTDREQDRSQDDDDQDRSQDVDQDTDQEVDQDRGVENSGGDAEDDTGSRTTQGDDDEDVDQAGAGTSAAERYGWGTPNRVDEFSGPDSAENWSIYDGPGHAGNGRRTPEAVTIADGALTITGDADGNTAGMAWNPGQKYGRWEGRVRIPAGDESYNALLLLWPDAENFPVGGELDFMETMSADRQSTELFLHYGADNSQVHGTVEVDATQWHNWAVEWTPDKITAFVDGEEWWSTTDTSIFPPGPMHLCIQLDWFPDGGDVQESSMSVDWVAQYSLDAGDEPSTDGDGSDGSTDADSSTTITDEVNRAGGSGSGGGDDADDQDDQRPRTDEQDTPSRDTEPTEET